MIQEKDFLYRVPVKTAPITTPRGQIRNPEILVDLEGGEFMRGNILDANSTNKLISQSVKSVKDAVDDKFIESGYVIKDLLEAETSARTKGDEDLSAKIKAEQTRAEGKEKEISDKLAIVDGDSNTEGSFRKAIADVIAAAPEDLDTLKEIADKLAGNDDLHTALNQAITEKADATALANEVTRATGAESGLQAAITEKADASALANEVTRATGAESGLQAAIATKADATALEYKQDAGYYVTYIRDGGSKYTLQKGFEVSNGTDTVAIDESGVDINIAGNSITLDGAGIMANDGGNNHYSIDYNGINLFNMDTEIRISPIVISSVDDKDTNLFNIDSTAIILGPTNNPNVKISEEGIKFKGKAASDIPTAGGDFINISDLASNEDISSLRAGLSRKQDKITVNDVDTTDIETADITKLRTIVTDLINALSASDLIRETKTLE